MKKIAIVSPSGKFYGSEQVLFDFLSATRHQYIVYLSHGLFYDKIRGQNKHCPHSYSSVKFLYIRLMFMLLFNKYDGIYINEGGHIKYLNLLADLFPRKRFFVHIRLLEDCHVHRLGKRRNNISYISVSEYITHEVMQNTHIQCRILYDIYQPISGFDEIRDMKPETICRLGIIGRVTTTKGLHDISRFCEYCEKHVTPFQLEFHFYGDIDGQISGVRSFIERTNSYKQIKCVFHGFVKDKIQIYQSIDILLHFNKVEPLGRILMEALDFGIPFIGFQSGGIGELARNFSVAEYMITDHSNWENAFQNQIINLITNKEKTIECFYNAKKKMKALCSPATYTQKIEELFNE
ncbi:glycosyltransferase [Dysgonomonas termitidis]|uniref:Glycosyltransferase n=1 Tax=Dysgonomonas termitidis TaxID=1516126 RepID=A0ABV9KWZ2_9BACT